MQYRHEVKHEISPADKPGLIARLRTVCKPDPHVGPNGMYTISSLYFDNLQDKALREKIDGAAHREKFRIRYYNQDPSFMLLEKKVKDDDLGYKLSALISKEEVQKLLDGDTSWMLSSGRELIVELYSKMHTELLRPRVIVDYTRTPFVYGPGNVRVTVDEQIRTSLRVKDFLKADHGAIPAGDDVMLLEVKWDGFLPANVWRAVQMHGHASGAFSKYARCRIYG